MDPIDNLSDEDLQDLLDQLRSPAQIAGGVVSQAAQPLANVPKQVAKGPAGPARGGRYLDRIGNDYDAALRQRLQQNLSAPPPEHTPLPSYQVGDVPNTGAHLAAVDASRQAQEQTAGAEGGLIALQQPVLHGNIQLGRKQNAFLDPQIQLLKDQAQMPLKRLAAQKADDDAVASEKLMRMLGQGAGLSPDQSTGLSGAGPKAADVLGKLENRRVSVEAKNNATDTAYTAAQNKAIEALLQLGQRDRENQDSKDAAYQLEELRQHGANYRAGVRGAQRAASGPQATRAAAQAAQIPQLATAAKQGEDYASRLDKGGYTGLKGALEQMLSEVPLIGKPAMSFLDPEAAKLQAERPLVLESTVRAKRGGVPDQTTLRMFEPTVPKLGMPNAGDIARQTADSMRQQGSQLSESMQSAGYRVPNMPDQRGGTKTINGVVYEKRDDGKWYPQGK